MARDGVGEGLGKAKGRKKGKGKLEMGRKPWRGVSPWIPYTFSRSRLISIIVAFEGRTMPDDASDANSTTLCAVVGLLSAGEGKAKAVAEAVSEGRPPPSPALSSPALVDTPSASAASCSIAISG